MGGFMLWQTEPEECIDSSVRGAIPRIGERVSYRRINPDGNVVRLRGRVVDVVHVSSRDLQARPGHSLRTRQEVEVWVRPGAIEHPDHLAADAAEE